ncbi:MAG TPA: hypothetical protein VLG40_02040 [Candidatus Saccharimonas sp.]|nr:hypothetical protein [Candidatus Saccharimonas sp.]
MATTKKSASQKAKTGAWGLSWKRLLVAGSITLNIAFIVVMLSVSISNALDGVFMASGLERYCSSVNDDKFNGSSVQVKALRNYVCDTPDAHQYFVDGLNKYLDSKGISH